MNRLSWKKGLKKGYGVEGKYIWVVVLAVSQVGEYLAGCLEVAKLAQTADD